MLFSSLAPAKENGDLGLFLMSALLPDRESSCVLGGLDGRGLFGLFRTLLATPDTIVCVLYVIVQS